MHRPTPARPPPNEASLRDAALTYLARYATSEAGLRRALLRRIDRWVRTAPDPEAAAEAAAAARAVVPGIVAGLVEVGVVNDAAFAQSRARGLALGGRSRRAVAAGLMAKGIDPDQARAAATGDELISALILARKRRIGPFRKTDTSDRNKELGVLARAGYPREVADRALAMDGDEAEERIRQARA